MSEKVSKLSQFANVKVTNGTQNLEQVEGMHLVINKAVIHKGDFGTYVDMTTQTDEGAVITVRTYNRVVINAMKAALDSEALPAEATFKNVDNRWVIE